MEAHAHRACAGDELCNRAEVAIGPATQPGLEEQPQARFGFPGKPPRGTGVHPVPGCSLPSGAPPRSKAAEHTRHGWKCSSQLGSQAPRWLLQALRLCSAGWGSWHPRDQCAGFGTFQDGSKIMYCRKGTAASLSPGKGNPFPATEPHPLLTR